MKDHKDALTTALVLAITAPTEDDLNEVLPMVDDIAAHLSPMEVRRCQKEALEVSRALPN